MGDMTGRAVAGLQVGWQYNDCASTGADRQVGRIQDYASFKYFLACSQVRSLNAMLPFDSRLKMQCFLPRPGSQRRATMQCFLPISLKLKMQCCHLPLLSLKLKMQCC